VPVISKIILEGYVVKILVSPLFIYVFELFFLFIFFWEDELIEGCSLNSSLVIKKLNWFYWVKSELNSKINSDKLRYCPGS